MAFEDFVEGDGDSLIFGDVEIGAAKSISFTVRNYSATPRRFAWETFPGLSFAPSVGHLQPQAAKQERGVGVG